MHGHKIINQNKLHFITCTVVGWLDVFTRSKYKDIIIDSLNYCIKNKGLVLNAYVIMSNHIHIIGYAPRSSKLVASMHYDCSICQKFYYKEECTATKLSIKINYTSSPVQLWVG